MRRCVSLFAAFLALSMLALVAPACGGTDEKVGDERCDNQQDDDADGLTDCADPDCSGVQACTDYRPEHCYNLVDDDNDGDVDCDDSECESTVTCVDTYESCASPGDEDGDGAVDCEDSDCINTATCTIGAEACGNKIDDDGDGQLDCEDEDCANTSECQAQPEDCSNETDDDADGDADCADSDCANTAACVAGGEQCGSGADEDGDGRIDCADTDCAYTRVCIGTLEICTNGIDDDADGAVDCADPECEEAVVCLNRREDCTNRIDDDGDADIDCADSDCADEPVCADEICDNGTDDDGDGHADCKDYDCARDASVCDCENLADVDHDDIPNCTDEDIDGDGLANDDDNCEFVENADQADEDADGIGDVCETDRDADGVIDDEDNCPDVFNPRQNNQDEAEETADPDDDQEVIGDACEDSDADGWPDVDDNCLDTFNPSQQKSYYGSSEGDACATVFEISYSAAIASGYEIGQAIAVGDVNGDGSEDILLGSRSFGTSDDKAFVMFGPFPTGTIYLNTTSEVTEISTGIGSSLTEFGSSVAVIGDLDGDSMSEFAVGSPEGTSGGEVRIFAGHDTAQQLQDNGAIATISSSTGTKLGGEVVATSDYTGDGTPDLLVTDVNPTACTVGFHLFSGALLTSGNLTEADAEFSFSTGADCTAHSIASGASITGDASPDIVFGVPRPLDAQGSPDTTGRVFVFDGSSLPTGAVGASAADATLAGAQADDRIGSKLAIDGDFDGDGIHDLAVSTGSSTALIWTGVSGSTLSGSAVVEVTGADGLGGPITLGLDFNKDGLADLTTAGTSSYSVVRIMAGRALSGSTTLDSGDGISVSERFDNVFGEALNAEADVNGDGVDDLLIGGNEQVFRFTVPEQRGAP